MSEGTTRLLIKPKKATRKRMKLRKLRSLDAVVTVRFRALAGGDLVTRTKSLKLATFKARKRK